MYCFVLRRGGDTYVIEVIYLWREKIFFEFLMVLTRIILWSRTNFLKQLTKNTDDIPPRINPNTIIIIITWSE